MGAAPMQSKPLQCLAAIRRVPGNAAVFHLLTSLCYSVMRRSYDRSAKYYEFPTGDWSARTLSTCRRTLVVVPGESCMG
jgi:hypothetical protein